MNESQRSLCFTCQHRGSVPGSTHSRCHHPSIVSTDRNELLAMLSGDIAIDTKSADTLGIKASAHGITKGWFNWPYDFDPTWLENCNGFERSEAVDAERTKDT